MNNRLAIIYRVSSNIHNKYALRPFGLNREEMVVKCFKSLLESCESEKNRIKIYIIEDNCSQNIKNMIEDALDFYGIKNQIEVFNLKSNSKTMIFSIDLAKKLREEIIYFAEDDYLYKKEAISFMLNAYDKRIIGTDKFALHPSDYPDRYEKIYPSYIFQSDYCHWRSIGHSTGVFMINKKLIKDAQKILYSYASSLAKPYGSEDDSLNKLWETIPLISPIPSLAAHLNDNTIPIFVDWESLL